MLQWLRNKFYFHSQNLNERGRHLPDGSMWRHGRSWLHLNPSQSRRIVLGVEWAVWPRHKWLNIGLNLATHDDVFSISFAPWLFSLHLSLEYWPWHSWLSNKIKRRDERYGNGRSIGISYSEDHLSLKLWSDPMEHRSSDPKWWSRGWFMRDVIFGAAKYTTSVLSIERVVVPMPEGGYPASVAIEKCTWERPRWFTRTLIRSEIKPDTPIPFPGKGESEYDCGEDATHSLTCNATTGLDAALALTRSVMKSRIRYGSGWSYKPVVKAS
jgi:hypothetical protein